MSTLDKVIHHRRKVDQAHRQVAVAEGSLKRAMEDLSQKYKCSTISKGKEHLQELKTTARRLQKQTDAKLSTFEKKWSDYL